MFSQKIIDSDIFIDMPISARCLYYDLNMRADDDGFVSSPKKIVRMTGASNDDLILLAHKNFIIPFESGICIITHWRIHNYIQKDRYQSTMYLEEKKTLEVDDTKAYKKMYPECIQNVSKMDTQVRLGKVRLELELGKENTIAETSSATASEIPKKTKNKYGEYKKVLLTESEFEKLQNEFSNADDLIAFLDEYIEMKGYKAKSHYLAIRKWVVNAVKEQKQRDSKINNTPVSGNIFDQIGKQEGYW